MGLPLLVLIAVVAAQGRPAHVETARSLYRAESCWQCHVHKADGSFPPLVGTKRTGPVIGAPGLARSAEWHRALFYAPRTLMAESQMPAYPRYFAPHPNEAAVRAFIEKHDTRDGSANQDGIVTRAEFTGADWDAALARLDASKNGVISLADAAPAADAKLEALIQDLGEVERVAPPSDRGYELSRDRPAAIARGAALFAQHCTGCHGARADGNGPAAPFFGNEPPRNFLRGEYKYRSSLTPSPPRDADLARTIRHGAGPSMPAWPDLSDRQVGDLVEFLKSNHPAYVPHELFVNELGSDTLFAFVKGETDVDDARGVALGDGRVVKRAGRWWWVRDGREQEINDGLEFEAGGKRYRARIGAAVFDWMDDFAPEPYVPPDETIAYSRASAEIGRKVYEEFGCATCHGAEGRGDGPAAAQQRGSLGQVMRPADYTRGPLYLKGGADAESLVRAFLTGLHGTPMPSYAGNFEAAKSAPPRDAPWHLAHFVMAQAGIPFDK